MPASDAPTTRTVRQTECVSSLAAGAGLLWESVWNDPANGQLRSSRADPNILLPGDRIAVRQREQGHESGATEQRHRFRLLGSPVKLRIRLLEEGEPLAQVPWNLTIEGEFFEGETDGDGRLEVDIPAQATSGTLQYRVGDRATELPLELGAIDPVDTVSGAQGRLRDLGYDAGPIDGNCGPRTASALRMFQREQDLDVTGSLNDATCGRLQDLFGA